MAPQPQRLTITRRAWPLGRPFATAQGTMTTADVVVAELYDGNARGRGEGVPIARFGESLDSVVATLEGMKAAIYSGLSRETLQDALPPGAARNALDCAFWDIDAKRLYSTVADLAGLAAGPVTTSFTLGLDTPEAMAEQAAAQRGRPMLTLKLGGEGDLERVRAVRAAAPTSRLIVDAGESWTAAQLAAFMPALEELRVDLIEQPLPAGADDALAGQAFPIPLCADESCRSRADLDGLAGKYQAINIKLDKVGGLTEALALAADAHSRGLKVMVGGAIGTSLAIAPALLVAQRAEFVDLDGPLHLAIDRGSGLRYEGGTIGVAAGKLWGGAE